MRSVLAICLMGIFFLALAACNGPTDYYGTSYANQPGYVAAPPVQGPPVIVPGPGPGPAPGGNWVLLGQTIVSFQGERESIQTDPRQNWRRLQLTVSDGAVELKAIRVNFQHAGSAPYDVPVRDYVLTGKRPAVVIELPGEPRRNIARIDFVYKAVDNSPKPTRITVLGQ